MKVRRSTAGTAWGVIAVVAIGLGLVAPTPATARSSVVSVRLRTAIRQLPVAAHSHASSYDRTKDFGVWISQGGGCNTRAVVLKDESLAPTTQNAYCTIETGKWYSFYNARYYTSPYGGALQIDHVVPTENTWISDAWHWTHATRVRYYNDLGDSRTLVAVDRNDNESKGDRDPSQWMPSHGRCRYITYWVAVKIRWRLTVTTAEKSALTRIAAQCPNTVLTVHRAQISTS
ncbi:MAG: endonuclease [Marmoricola sp.]|nr:endonuclease [Marmoricola sp.]